MKASNKLLLGLFVLVVVSMITGTILLKTEVKKNVRIENRIDTKSQADTISNNSNSIHINIR